MENSNATTHHHRYLYHFEIIITFLAVVLLSFGLYSGVFGQTGGTTYYNPNNTVRNDVQYAPAGTQTNTGSNWWQGGNNDRTNTNTSNTGSYGGTAGGTGNTAGTGGSGYYGTSGGVYNYQGINDPGAVPTQGGYNANRGSGVYNSAGIVEAGAVPTQGSTINSGGQGVFTGKYIDESLAVPTQQNTLSPKNCAFITKYHKFGDRGGDVPKIQQFLKDRGYYKGRIDGVYGISTFRAVQAFQRDYKDKILDPWEFNNKSSTQGTGVTNVSTKYAINKMVGCPDPATIVPKTGKVLNY